jgi:amino acid transporter
LCYAEFAARLPRAGTAYVYSYVTLGELCAFVIGWNMILENVIGAVVAAKAWSMYLDHMMNNTIHR